MAKGSGRQALRFFVLEGLVVVFGVLVALGVDDVREERALDAAVETAQADIVREIRANFDELTEMDSVLSARD